MIGNSSLEKDLTSFGWQLAKSGYSEFYHSFDPLTPRFSHWLVHREDAPADLRTLIDLFLLNKPVEADRLSGIEAFLDPLLELGILDQSPEGTYQTPDLVLIPILGFWYFCQKPQVNPTIYFGDDSLALVNRLTPRRQGRSLDLCSGPGIQAIICSNFAAEVTAVEINPFPYSLAKINVAINDLGNKIRLIQGDLYKPLGGEVFDQIIANPPLLPFPDDLFYPFVGHGGETGFKVTEEILKGLPLHLAKDGIAQMLGCTLSDSFLPVCDEYLDQYAKDYDMEILMTITSHHLLAPGYAFYDGLISTSAACSKKHVEEISAIFDASLKKYHATHLCAFFLQVSHSRNKSGSFRLMDMSRDGTSKLWYV